MQNTSLENIHEQLPSGWQGKYFIKRYHSPSKNTQKTHQKHNFISEIYIMSWE